VSVWPQIQPLNHLTEIKEVVPLGTTTAKTTTTVCTDMKTARICEAATALEPLFVCNL
jgi:hypothetical protein